MAGAIPPFRTLLRDTALPRLEARMLWQRVLRVSTAWLIAHDLEAPTAAQLAQYQSLQARRLSGEPMAYILGAREFMGHEFIVTPDVLIPRPDTELLVETALRQLEEPLPSAASGRRKVLDLGTGSGAVAISIALSRPDVDVIATDISMAALAVASKNAHALGARVEFLCGTWYDALLGMPVGGFDLIVSNPPYIAADDQHLRQGDLRFEPGTALTDGADGLTAIRHIIDGAPGWLRAGGALYLEHGWDQAASARRLLMQAGFDHVASRVDLAGIERVSGGLYN